MGRIGRAGRPLHWLGRERGGQWLLPNLMAKWYYIANTSLILRMPYIASACGHGCYVLLAGKAAGRGWKSGLADWFSSQIPVGLWVMGWGNGEG